MSLEKDYIDGLMNQDLPGKGNTSFVVTLKNAHFSDPIIVSAHETQITAEVESVEEVKDCGYWVPYDKDDQVEKRYIGPGKYLVCRKDGKIHFEMFNGTGWAHNEKSIIFYADINSPI